MSTKENIPILTQNDLNLFQDPDLFSVDQMQKYLDKYNLKLNNGYAKIGIRQNDDSIKEYMLNTNQADFGTLQPIETSEIKNSNQSLIEILLNTIDDRMARQRRRGLKFNPIEFKPMDNSKK